MFKNWQDRYFFKGIFWCWQGFYCFYVRNDKWRGMKLYKEASILVQKIKTSWYLFKGKTLWSKMKELLLDIVFKYFKILSILIFIEIWKLKISFFFQLFNIFLERNQINSQLIINMLKCFFLHDEPFIWRYKFFLATCWSRS